MWCEAGIRKATIIQIDLVNLNPHFTWSFTIESCGIPLKVHAPLDDAAYDQSYG